MTATNTIHDPKQPPYALVETFDDGTALRNDGHRLQSQWTNPWYVLATTYGALKPTDQEGQRRNRRIWNGWACHNLTQEKRDEISETLGLPPEELAPLTEAEQTHLEKKFRHHFPDRDIPSPNESVHFQNLFLQNCYWDGYVFPHGLNIRWSAFSGLLSLYNSFIHGISIAHTQLQESSFDAAKFSEDVYVENCQFTDVAWFAYAQFRHVASFTQCTFPRGANFADVTSCALLEFGECSFCDISGYLSLTHATVKEEMYLSHCTLNGPVFFENAKLRGHSSIEGSSFARGVKLSGTSFGAATYFTGAQFHNLVPTFYDCELYPETEFSLDKHKWVTRPKSPMSTDPSFEISVNKDAYERLKHEMNKLQKTDAENFFYRQELRCKALLEPWYYRPVYWIYETASDNGYSIARPAGWLLALIILLWGFYGSVFRNVAGFEYITAPILDGFVISVGNTLPFLGIGNSTYAQEISQFPAWLKLLSAIQGLLGLVLLFFLGLGLRTRFRWR